MFNSYQLPGYIGSELWPDVPQMPQVVRVSLRVAPDLDGYVDNEHAIALARDLIDSRRGAIQAFLLGQRQNALLSALPVFQKMLMIDDACFVTYSKLQNTETVAVTLTVSGSILEAEEAKIEPCILVMFKGNRVAALDSYSLKKKYTSKLDHSNWGDDVIPVAQYKFSKAGNSIIYGGFYTAHNSIFRYSKYCFAFASGGAALKNFLETDAVALSVAKAQTEPTYQPYSVKSVTVSGGPPIINGDGKTFYTSKNVIYIKNGRFSKTSAGRSADPFAISSSGTYYYSYSQSGGVFTARSSANFIAADKGSTWGAAGSYSIYSWAQGGYTGSVTIHEDAAMNSSISVKVPWMIFSQSDRADSISVSGLPVTTSASYSYQLIAGYTLVGGVIPISLFTSDIAQGYTWLVWVASDGTVIGYIKYPDYKTLRAKLEEMGLGYIITEDVVGDQQIYNSSSLKVGGATLTDATDFVNEQTRHYERTTIHPFPHVMSDQQSYRTYTSSSEFYGVLDRPSTFDTYVSTPHVGKVFPGLEIEDTADPLAGTNPFRIDAPSPPMAHETFMPWMHASNGRTNIQGFVMGGNRYLYSNGNNVGDRIAKILNISVNDIQAVVLDVPLERIQSFT